MTDDIAAHDQLLAEVLERLRSKDLCGYYVVTWHDGEDQLRVHHDLRGPNMAAYLRFLYHCHEAVSESALALIGDELGIDLEEEQ